MHPRPIPKVELPIIVCYVYIIVQSGAGMFMFCVGMIVLYKHSYTYLSRMQNDATNTIMY